MISLKSKEEIEKIKKAGRVVAGILQALKKRIQSGVTTQQLEEMAQVIARAGRAQLAFKNYRKFPKGICTSVNEEVVHGIPDTRQLKKGDIIGIDVGILFEGYYADAAITVPVGKLNASVYKLLSVTEKALYDGIKEARQGNRLSDISFAIQDCVEKEGFSVVRDLCGHGIGRALHEEPQVPNFGLPRQGPLLKKGMVLAIEPMVNQGEYKIEIASNGWTVITKDKSLSAHFEHTIVITEDKPEILTQ